MFTDNIDMYIYIPTNTHDIHIQTHTLTHMETDLFSENGTRVCLSKISYVSVCCLQPVQDRQSFEVFVQCPRV